MGCGASNGGVCDKSRHVQITNVTVNKQPDIYLEALEERIHIKCTTPKDSPNDYLEILKELRYHFFQYLDERTELKDDRGRQVSARYRKAMDWRLYVNFEREFALELYRRRDETISREVLSFLLETYIQKTDTKLRPQYLSTSKNNDNRIYIGQILIIPPADTLETAEIARSLRNSENRTEQLIEYESLLERKFQTIAGSESISADDYVLLLLLYNEALEKLRNRSQGIEQQTIINNFSQIFDTKRRMIQEYRRNYHQREEIDIPDTHSYTEDVEKELKENEGNIDIKKWIGRYGTKTERSHSQLLKEYIDRQMKLIKQMEEKRLNELKLIEEEIEAGKASDFWLDSSDSDGEETDHTEDQFRNHQIMVEQKMQNIHNKLKEVIMDDPSNEDNIKKELEDIRKKIRKTVLEVDDEQKQQLGSTDEESMDLHEGNNDHIESTEIYGNKVKEELSKDDDLLMDHIKQLRERKQDKEEFEKLKEHLHNRLQNQSRLMIEMEENRKEVVGKTESDLVHCKLTEMKTKCLKNMSEDVTDDDQIRQNLEKYRQDQRYLATEVSCLRQEKLKQLKQRHEEAREKTGKSDEDENEMGMLDLEDSSFHFSSDYDEEFTKDTSELITAMKEIEVEGSDLTEKRCSMLEEHLDKLEEKFKRLDAERNDLVTEIEQKTNVEEEMVEHMNMDFVRAIEENIDTLDDEMATQMLQEHKMSQIKFMEHLDSERIQRKNRLAQKLRTDKPEEQTRMPPVLERDEYWEAVDKELQHNAEELMEFLTDGTDYMNEGNRENEISDRLDEYVDRQKQIVTRFESERREISCQEAIGPNKDLDSNLSEINGWLRRNLLNGTMASEEDVKDKLVEYRNKQKKLLEDVDSKRLQQKKILQLKLKKLREEKELKNGGTSETQSSDMADVADEIAKITKTNAQLSEKDKEFVKVIYLERKQNTPSDEEVQKRILEHVSDKLKMNELIKQKNKSTKNQIRERKNMRRIQEEEEQQMQEKKEEEDRNALAKHYKDKVLSDWSSCYKRLKDDQKRMSKAFDEGSLKARDLIERKKSQKKKRNSIEQTTETNHEQSTKYSNNHETQNTDYSEENLSENNVFNKDTSGQSSEDITTETEALKQNNHNHKDIESQKTDFNEQDTSKKDTELNKSTLSTSFKEDKPETKYEQHVQISSYNIPQQMDLSEGDVSKEDRKENKMTSSPSSEDITTETEALKQNNQNHKDIKSQKPDSNEGDTSKEDTDLNKSTLSISFKEDKPETKYEQHVQNSSYNKPQQMDLSQGNVSKEDRKENKMTSSPSSEDITTEAEAPNQNKQNHKDFESLKTDSSEGDTSKEETDLKKSTLSISADEITRQSKPDTQKMNTSEEDISKEDTSLNEATRSILLKEDKPETKYEQHFQNSSYNKPQQKDFSQGDVSKEDRVDQDNV